MPMNHITKTIANQIKKRK